jgi:hypothetical protein
VGQHLDESEKKDYFIRDKKEALRPFSAMYFGKFCNSIVMIPQV